MFWCLQTSSTFGPLLMPVHWNSPHKHINVAGRRSFPWKYPCWKSLQTSFQGFLASFFKPSRAPEIHANKLQLTVILLVLPNKYCLTHKNRACVVTIYMNLERHSTASYNTKFSKFLTSHNSIGAIRKFKWYCCLFFLGKISIRQWHWDRRGMQ